MNEPTEREWLEGLRYEDKFPDEEGKGCDEIRLVPCRLNFAEEPTPIGYPSAAWENGITREEALRLSEARRTQMGSYCGGAMKLRRAFDFGDPVPPHPERS